MKQKLTSETPLVQLHLEQHRPDKNRFRFYALEKGQDMFGTWVVIRRWGRIGQSERMVSVSFDTENAAEAHVLGIWRAKQKRGYARLPEQLDLPL